MFMGGDVSIASTKSGTAPKPLPANGTKTFEERKKHPAGIAVPGALSRCQSDPGFGASQIHFAVVPSMSSKKRTLFPCAVIFTSSTVHPRKLPVWSWAEMSWSDPNRNRSWTGWGRVVHEFGMSIEALMHEAPKSPL